MATDISKHKLLVLGTWSPFTIFGGVIILLLVVNIWGQHGRVTALEMGTVCLTSDRTSTSDSFTCNFKNIIQISWNIFWSTSILCEHLIFFRMKKACLASQQCPKQLATKQKISLLISFSLRKRYLKTSPKKGAVCLTSQCCCSTLLVKNYLRI